MKKKKTNQVVQAVSRLLPLLYLSTTLADHLSGFPFTQPPLSSNPFNFHSHFSTLVRVEFIDPRPGRCTVGGLE
ncbi:hypothetical protein BDE02_06G120100 [Populus trichocarpa]|nr:hypothetical protein BDE02_06G120100 [Populus trichocarpa]